MTPHIALASYGVVILTVAIILDATGTSPLTLFGDAGTMAAFGFLVAYYLVSIASPFYLRKLGELRARNVLIAVAAFACLMVPTVGSFYPAPPWPVNLFPYLFLLFMLLGGARLYQMHRARPEALPAIQRDLERALAASAHEIAVSEEEHQQHPAHVPGQRLHPVPAGTGSAASMISAAPQRPTGANIVSATRRTE